MLKKIFVTLFFLPMIAFSQQVVNVYNWSGYISPKVIQLFEKKTGIHVNYSTFDSNQMLYTKLKTDPNAGYDVIFPSTYYVQRMRQEGMLHVLDKSKLPKVKNLNQHLLNLPYDPHNKYSLPYLWGSTGIIVNRQYFSPSTVTTWRDLWQKRFANQLLMTNEMRDVFAVALRVLGYSINDRNPQHIHQAFLKLKQLLPNIKLFNSEATQPIYLDGDAAIGMLESGDAYVLTTLNPNLVYIYPRDGVNLWMDCMAIPKYAPHLNNAYRFINFILQAKVAKMISLNVGYSSPNSKAVKLMTVKQQHNQILNPPASIFKHAQMEGAVGSHARALYLHYFELLKLLA